MVMSLIGFDPLEMVTEVAVIILFSVALWFMWVHWRRVLLVLGFDDRIHCTFLDVIWYGGFHCCGLCNGDFTRLLTSLPCCLCCPSLRKKNLVQVIGQWMGFTTVTVELQNIIVGDLPFDGRGDFFVSVEVQNNPPMYTSVAEEKHAKVVHFPETITVKLCKNLLEMPLTIKVFNMHPVFGNVQLCACQLGAMQVLSWSDDDAPGGRDAAGTAIKVMRFQMKNLVDSPEVTPPWISLEFDQPGDARNLHDMPVQVDVVRTLALDGDGSPMLVKNLGIADFKHQFILLDPNGQATHEPLEQDLVEIEWIEWLMRRIRSFILVWVTVGSTIYLAVRTYAWSCFRQYKFFTMAAMDMQHENNFQLTWPVPKTQIRQMVVYCNAQFEGTGIEHSLPCRPSDEEIMPYCLYQSEGGSLPEVQQRPVAFAHLVHDTLGLDLPGVGCSSSMPFGIGSACDLRNRMAVYDHWIPVALVGPIVLHFAMGWACRLFIKHKKKGHSDEAAKATREMQLRRVQDRESASWSGRPGP